MPAIDFPGADAGVAWNDLSPRVGMTYDLTGNGRTVRLGVVRDLLRPDGARAAVERAGRHRRGVRALSRGPTPTATASCRPTRSTPPGSRSAAARPTIRRTRRNFRRPARSTRTSRTTGRASSSSASTASSATAMAVGASYIWRKYDRFLWNDRDQLDAAPTTAPVTFDADRLPGGRRAARRSPTSSRPSPIAVAVRVHQRARPLARLQRLRADLPEAHGEPLVDERQLRLQQRRRHVGFAGVVRGSDLHQSRQPGARGSQIYAPEAGGSGIDNVFINAKWLVKLYGRVQLPWDINLAASTSARQGYPFPQAIRTPNRANSARPDPTCTRSAGREPLDNLHTSTSASTAPSSSAAISLMPAMDMFNLTNANTVLASAGTRRRRTRTR